LAANVPVLTDGSSQLTSGAVKINDGADKLADGSSKLGNGLSEVKDGTAELNGKLNDGAKKVQENQTSQKTYEMIASPTKVLMEKVTDVPNYGHALAPNFLSLALYIGALAFNTTIPLGIAAIKPRSGRDWWFSKFSIGSVQAIMGALIMDLIVVKGLGLEVHHMGLFILISLLTSVTYMSLIMMLSIGLGNPGKFVAMILLVLQLASSGAMFPRELTGSFFDAINPYLPMTYVIYGFREAISSSEGISQYVLGVSVLAICFVLFNMVLLFVFNRRTRNGMDIIPNTNSEIVMN